MKSARRAAPNVFNEKITAVTSSPFRAATILPAKFRLSSVGATPEIMRVIEFIIALHQFSDENGFTPRFGKTASARRTRHC